MDEFSRWVRGELDGLSPEAMEHLAKAQIDWAPGVRAEAGDPLPGRGDLNPLKPPAWEPTFSQDPAPPVTPKDADSTLSDLLAILVVLAIFAGSLGGLIYGGYLAYGFVTERWWDTGAAASTPQQLGQTGETCDTLRNKLSAAQTSIGIGVSSSQRDVDYYQGQLKQWGC